MKFEKIADNPNEQMFFLHTSGKWLLYVYPVMFGFRIRLSKKGAGVSHFDYCAGSLQENVEKLFSILKTICEKETETSLSKVRWPSQEKKPIFGTQCAYELEQMAGEYEEIDYMLPVSKYRRAAFKVA